MGVEAPQKAAPSNKILTKYAKEIFVIAIFLCKNIQKPRKIRF